jgi:DNA invertase Pin-like site-specific DNA recombinase
MKVALYARVSTRQHGQDVQTQLVALRAWAELRNVTIVAEYADRGWSGSKERRPELDRLMKDARRRQFDAVVVARFDRFARSVKHLILALDEFNGLSIDFISLSENVDTSTPMGRMVFHVLAAVAELERALIRERVQLGVDRARKEGKHLGRPRKREQVDEHEIRRQLDAGTNISALSRQWGIARSTVREIRKRQGTPVPQGTPGRQDQAASGAGCGV